MEKDELDALNNVLDGENDIENFLQDKKKNQETYNRNLRSMAKKPSDLIISFDCRIKNVFGEIEPIYEREHFIGYTQNLKLEVFAWDNKIPVKRIIFPAFVPLEKGDFVRAYVIKGEYKTERRGISVFEGEGDRHFIERDYLEEEKAFRLDKLRDNQVVACYIDKSVKT